MRRFATLALMLLPAAALAGPGGILSSTLFAIPVGGVESFNGAVIETGGGNDGRTSIMYGNNSGNQYVIRYSAGGLASAPIQLVNTTIDTNGSSGGFGVDPSGNFLVSARIHANNNDDIGLLAFSQAGAMLWSTALVMSSDDSNFNGPVVVDNAGYAYVAGDSGGNQGPSGNGTTWLMKVNSVGIAWSVSQPASQ